MNSIHIITMCKNEVDIIQQYIDHHKTIVDKITIIDNGSTDGTLDILMNNDIELIYNKSSFKNKIKIIKQFIKSSTHDLIIPLDTDEFMVYDSDNAQISGESSVIREYLQNLDINYSLFKIKRIYNYIPYIKNKYSIEQGTWRSKKFIVKRQDFKNSCPGFHSVTSKTDMVYQTEISYIHKHYRSFDAWYNSSKQKMIARIGEDWNNLEILKNYTGYSNHTAKELYHYFTTGNWTMDLQPDIEINL